MLITNPTKSAQATRKLGEAVAKKLLQSGLQKEAVVLVLRGNLGAGKTTFLQGFAKGLGVSDKVLSPTFVILKRFAIRGEFKHFYHLDCYRLKNGKETASLDFKKIISNPQNLVAIEWPEKIKSVLPKKMIEIEFKFIDERHREIKIKM